MAKKLAGLKRTPEVVSTSSGTLTEARREMKYFYMSVKERHQAGDGDAVRRSARAHTAESGASRRR